jgi:gluconate 2-dehydrogenase gamma chain
MSDERSPDTEPVTLSRRSVIASAAFVPLAALSGQAQQAGAPAAAPAPQSALTPAQMRILEAFIDRICPQDELGPSGVDMGAQIYIDRVLAGPNAGEKTSFIEGLAAMDDYARRTHGAGMADLPADKRDAVLTAMDDGKAEGWANARAFFNRARRLTLEGMFSDPYYGGNRNFAGWDLIRYPGPRLAVGPDEQKMKVGIKPYRRSAYGSATNNDAHH